MYSQLEEHADEVMETLMETVAHIIVSIDDVECIYENNITKVASVIADTLRDMTVQITTYDQWLTQKEALIEDFKQYLLEELS